MVQHNSLEAQAEEKEVLLGSPANVWRAHRLEKLGEVHQS